MSDEELVKRLRSCAFTGVSNQQVVYVDKSALEQAAAAIEALTAERDEALNQLDSARHSVDVLEKRVAFVEGERRKTFQALLKVTKIHDDVEAKLAKAVEALRFGVDLIEGDSFGHEWKKGQADFRRMARAIIAEIEGEKT
jgi:septal ring factor EnvC (AmiA/AmiB activator)